MLIKWLKDELILLSVNVTIYKEVTQNRIAKLSIAFLLLKTPYEGWDVQMIVDQYDQTDYGTKLTLSRGKTQK